MTSQYWLPKPPSLKPPGRERLPGIWTGLTSYQEYTRSFLVQPSEQNGITSLLSGSKVKFKVRSSRGFLALAENKETVKKVLFCKMWKVYVRNVLTFFWVLRWHLISLLDDVKQKHNAIQARKCKNLQLAMYKWQVCSSRGNRAKSIEQEAVRETLQQIWSHLVTLKGASPCLIL